MDVLIEKLRDQKYANMDDQQAADAIEAETVVVQRLVPVVEIKNWAVDNEVYSPIIIGQESSDLELRKLCISIAGWVDDAGGRVQNADFTKPSAIKMMAGLVAKGIATQMQIDSLKALQFKTIKWSESVGISTVGRGMVYNARLAISRGA